MRSLFKRCAALAFIVFMLFGPTRQQLWAATGSMGHMDLLRAINDARGKVVVVNFFASWCAPCVMEIPGIKEIRAAYPEGEVFVVGLSLDEEVDRLEKLARETAFNYPIYLAKSDATRMFQVTGIPKTLIYSKKGALVVNHDGFMDAGDLKHVIEEQMKP